jgi:plasmid stability protein
MVQQTVTVHLPDVIYRQVQQRASRMRHSVEDELVAVVAAVLPTLDDLPSDIADKMAQLAFLADDELWRMARASLTPQESDQMQSLMFKRQSEGLTLQEQREAEHLLHRYDQTMLVRAQAAALLQERGHDISSLRRSANAS